MQQPRGQGGQKALSASVSPIWAELLWEVPLVHGKGWTGSTTMATKSDTCHSQVAPTRGVTLTKAHRASQRVRARARQRLQRRSSPRSVPAFLCRSLGQGEVGRAGGGGGPAGTALSGCQGTAGLLLPTGHWTRQPGAAADPSSSPALARGQRGWGLTLYRLSPPPRWGL